MSESVLVRLPRAAPAAALDVRLTRVPVAGEFIDLPDDGGSWQIIRVHHVPSQLVGYQGLAARCQVERAPRTLHQLLRAAEETP